MANKIGGIVTKFAKTERTLIIAIMVIVGLMSGILSNTGTAAVLIPVVIGIAAKSGYKRSRLLMPLVFAAAMGGNLSLIGAPGNLIAQSALSEIGLKFGFFEYAVVGMPILIAGIIFYATIGYKLLPSHDVKDDGAFDTTKDFSDVPKWKQWLSLIILVFTFDSRDSGCANDYLPHNYPVNSVAYTGTHDNETIVGWWSSITKEEQKLARDYMCDQYTPENELYKSLISLIMRSSAKLCVVPMQDYLGLGNNCRMNTPSTVGKNWKWRVNSRQLSLKLQKEIQEMTLRYGRMNWETVE